MFFRRLCHNVTEYIVGHIVSEVARNMFSTSTLIYIGHFLSAWGDRMWQFAVPLFLLNLEHQSLTLTAAYGLTVASSVLLFAPLVGEWIDRSPRLYAARMSLIIQNLTVILCALMFIFASDRNSSYIVFVKVAAILIGCVTQLASTAMAIIIQKDWIVVVAGGNLEVLANLNSVTRRIDLVTKMLAPAACGQVMSLLNLSTGAIFIMSWNALSMFVEYFLLRIVYKRTPNLSKTHDVNPKSKEEEVNLILSSSRSVDFEQKSDVAIFSNNNENGNEKVEFRCYNRTGENQHANSDIVKESATQLGDDKPPPRISNAQDVDLAVCDACIEDTRKSLSDDTLNLIDDSSNKSFKTYFHSICKVSVLKKIFAAFIILKDGWKLYIAQPISLPCFGFSFLYMTLLGFGYITLAYEYSQCLSEFTVGLMNGGAAITGIIATFMYPLMRRRYGVIRTGVFSALFQLSTLIPCIVSVFVDGSPFYLLPANQLQLSNDTLSVATSTIVVVSVTTASSSYPNNFTSTEENSSVGSQLFLKCLDGISPPSSYLSMVLFMAGIILARIGLWGFDLAITQLIQESVAESKRGVFSGVQSSLNNLMDL